MNAPAFGPVTSPSLPRRLPAMARVFLGLLGRLKVGTVLLTTPEQELLHFQATPEPCVDLSINDWSACQKILRAGDIGFAESYRDGLLECSDLTQALLLALANQDVMEQTIFGSFWGTLAYRLRHLFNRNTRAGSKQNIHAHYDIGNDFYRLWLDRSMTYSSALFPQDNMSLEQAQYHKYERLLSLLHLKPGDHLLEIGCGWGGLAEYAATTRGVRVTGISLSQEQLAWARQRVQNTAAAGLCHFQFLDYRDLKDQFDAIISIEMLEAVGESYWPSYFQQLKILCRPGGRIALQTITIAHERFADYRRQTDFIQQYIFPGGMLPSPQALQQQCSRAGLQIENLHDFGLDYAETLRRWRAAFEAALPAIREQGFDEAFIRLWRFYYCICEAGFESRRTSVCQLVLKA